MRIFYFFKELNTPMYQWQRMHFFDELQRKGHKIITFNPLNFSSIDKANEELIKTLKLTPNIDLFMNSDDSSVLYPSTMKDINKLGIPSLLICWDNLELPYKHKSIAPLFDIVWITSIETKYLFEQWKCKNIIFQSFAANPYTFTPNWIKPINKVGFIGSPYGSRINKLNDLLEGKIPCEVFSDSLFNIGYNTSLGKIQKFKAIDVLIKASRYMRFPIGRKVLYSTIKNKFIKKTSLYVNNEYLTKQKSVDDNEMIKLYSNLTISLNITELRDTYILKKPINKIHLRTFEIPMSGGLELASYTEELSNYFKEDKEIVLYRSKEEMLDKARFYLDKKNEKIVQTMKNAAREKAAKDHTWSKRFENIFKTLNL